MHDDIEYFDDERRIRRPHGAGGHGAGPSGERWLLTYADVITLMMALFIILFAMSTVSRVKFEAFAKDVSGGFNNQWAINQPPNGETFDSTTAKPQEDLRRVMHQLQAYITKNHLEKQLEVHLTRRGLVVSLLSDDSYYDSGSAQLRPETRQILEEIDGFIRKTSNPIRVEGNTDNVPIHTAQYESNWDLSVARSVEVIRYFVDTDHLDPTRISAAGYAEYRPRGDNHTDAGRQLNRRVDIVLMAH